MADLIDLQAERRVLAALMARPALAHEEQVDADLFFHEGHERMRAIVLRRWAAGEPYDHRSLVPDALAADLPPSLPSELAGLDTYDFPRSASPLVRRLRALTLRRAVRAQGLEIATRAGQADDDPTEVLHAGISKLSALAVGRGKAWTELPPELTRAHGALRTAVSSGEGLRLRTGVAQLDSMLGGLSRRGVTLVLAGSGMGKTTIANRLALGLAAQGKHVLLHGTETTEQERAEDLLFSLARVDPVAYDNAYPALRARQDGAMEAAQVWADQHLQTLTLSAKGCTVTDLRGRAVARKALGRLDVLMVDYLQDLAHDGSGGLRRGDQQAQVAWASTALKELSAQLDIPVVLFAQRSGEKEGPGGDPRPAMWDCQWSSRAHQDAEEVLGLYRDDYYAERDPAWSRKGPAGQIEVIRRKCRRGALATAYLTFHGPTKWAGDSLPDFEVV